VHSGINSHIRAAVMICATLVNTHTGTRTDSFWPVILLLTQPAGLKIQNNIIIRMV